MELYKCTYEDLDSVILIGRETYYDTFQSMNSTATMEQYLDEAFCSKKIEAELKNPQSSFYFLYDKGSLVAYMKLNLPPAQSDLNEKESLELERIYVRKDYKGSGYGRFLIKKALSFARENRCTYIWLGVWEKNVKAIEFYKKMSFEIFDTHTFQMGDEIQNDYILKMEL